jgi:hypothetical protein
MLGRRKDPVAGTARLIGYDEARTPDGASVTIHAEVVIEAEGIPPQPAEMAVSVPLFQLPLYPGHTWRVLVDRNHPRHVQLIEDGRRLLA